MRVTRLSGCCQNCTSRREQPETCRVPPLRRMMRRRPTSLRANGVVPSFASEMGVKRWKGTGFYGRCPGVVVNPPRLVVSRLGVRSCVEKRSEARLAPCRSCRVRRRPPQPAVTGAHARPGAEEQADGLQSTAGGRGNERSGSALGGKRAGDRVFSELQSKRSSFRAGTPQIDCWVDERFVVGRHAVRHHRAPCPSPSHPPRRRAGRASSERFPSARRR